jgi:hypothetical protein
MTAHHNRSISESFYPVLLENFLSQTYCKIPKDDPMQELCPRPLTTARDDENMTFYSKGPRLVPDQISIVHPSAVVAHKFYDTEDTLEAPFLRRFLGLVIHDALAQEAVGAKYDFKSLWQLQASKLSQNGRSVLATRKELEIQALTEVQNLIHSQAWKELFSDLTRCYPEYRIVQLHKQKMMVGSCDLYLEKRTGEVFIVEWKTANPSPDLDLQDFAQQMGFTKQVRQYINAMSALKPKANITGLLWFTKYDKPLQVK